MNTVRPSTRGQCPEWVPAAITNPLPALRLEAASGSRTARVAVAAVGSASPASPPDPSAGRRCDGYWRPRSLRSRRTVVSVRPAAATSDCRPARPRCGNSDPSLPVRRPRRARGFALHSEGVLDPARNDPVRSRLAHEPLIARDERQRPIDHRERLILRMEMPGRRGALRHQELDHRPATLDRLARNLDRHKRIHKPDVLALTRKRHQIWVIPPPMAAENRPSQELALLIAGMRQRSGMLLDVVLSDVR